MADLTAKKIDDIPPYEGSNSIPGIQFRPAGKNLGVSSWGMNVVAIDAGCTGYPEHDHGKDGQEEVYVVLEGSGTLDAAGEKTALAKGTLVRVGPSAKRKIHPGDGGIVLLVIGGIPGKVWG